jgi:hypothetical protein
MEDKRLFPELPEDLNQVSLADLQALKAEHDEARTLIQEEDASLAEMDANYILAELERGANQNSLLVKEIAAHEKAHEAYLAKKAEIDAQFDAQAEEEAAEEEAEAEETLEVVAEEAVEEPEAVEEEVVEEPELVLASADPTPETKKAEPQRFSRTPPVPSAARVVVSDGATTGNALVAAGEMSRQFEGPLDSLRLGELVKATAMHYGPHPHDGTRSGPKGRDGRPIYDGPTHKMASATYAFPEERTLDLKDGALNMEKIGAVVPDYIPGGVGKLKGEALVASGGLCAPAEPFYSLVNFATTAEPVWDALPIFAARRGAVNVPESTYIADILVDTAGGAITSVSEADDALGGTFATKTCQDLDCLEYTETAVQIIAHCRTYGNLNARSWPELIAHENDLTMAALARTSETFMLDRIKSLSINVTGGAETLGALIYLIDNIVKARFGIIGRFRMPRDTRFRALIPYWVPDLLLLDTIQTPFDRFRSQADLVAYLRGAGIDPVFYLDSPSTGTTQLPDSSQTAAAIDSLPDNVQWALYPEGAFLGIDMGVLELGIVRDSVLNETNDFQVFGERFRNVVRIAPAQSAYWVTSDLCANGQFPPAGTARTCD